MHALKSCYYKPRWGSFNLKMCGNCLFSDSLEITVGFAQVRLRFSLCDWSFLPCRIVGASLTLRTLLPCFFCDEGLSLDPNGSYSTGVSEDGCAIQSVRNKQYQL